MSVGENEQPYDDGVERVFIDLTTQTREVE